MRKRRGQAGYALVAVLWTVALLSLVAAMMISQSRTAALIDRNEWTRFQRETFAKSALNLTILSLISKGGVGASLLSGAEQPFEFDDRDFVAKIRDETGKVDLNESDAQLLAGLFEAAGAVPERAATIAEAVLHWRDPTGLAANAQNGKNSFRRFQSIDELRLVQGVDDALFDSVRPVVTVYSQASSINTNVAPELALNAVFRNEHARIASLLAERRTRSAVAVTESSLQSEQDVNLTGRAYSIAISFEERGKIISTETVVRITNDSFEPYWVLARTGY